MGVIIKGIEMPETGVYILSVDNSNRDKTIFTIAEHTQSGKIIVRHVGEAVPITQCKDCQYFNPHVMECEGIGKWFGLENEWSANDYCSKGEREEE